MPRRLPPFEELHPIALITIGFFAPVVLCLILNGGFGLVSLADDLLRPHGVDVMAQVKKVPDYLALLFVSLGVLIVALYVRRRSHVSADR